MAGEIKPTSVDVVRPGFLVVVLSEHPQQQWRQFFADYFKNPDRSRSSFRKSALEAWDEAGPILKTTVEEFKTTYRDVVSGAAKHANEQTRRAEAKREAKRLADATAQAGENLELEKERQKASEITFD